VTCACLPVWFTCLGAVAYGHRDLSTQPTLLASDRVGPHKVMCLLSLLFHNARKCASTRQIPSGSSSASNLKQLLWCAGVPEVDAGAWQDSSFVLPSRAAARAGARRRGRRRRRLRCASTHFGACCFSTHNLLRCRQITVDGLCCAATCAAAAACVPALPAWVTQLNTELLFS
jgi:hypothetical protein